MSHLEDLIAEHCPDGVGYKKLGDICNITTGKLNANAMTEDGEYPFFTCAKEVYKINKFAFDTEALLVSGNGSQVGHIHHYKGKFNAYQRTYVLDNFSENIRYVEFVLRAFLKKRIIDEVNLSGVPYIRLDALTEFLIPIPPIIVQLEIVHILDKMTELERELEAELEARILQYEYYRNNLLDFSSDVPRPPRLTHLLQTLCPDGIRYSKITDVCLPTYLIDWASNLDETFEYIDLSSVDRTNHAIVNTTQIDALTAPSRAKKIVNTNDIIIGTTRPTLKRYCMVPDDYDGQICSTGFCVLKSVRELVLPRYLYHIISHASFWEYTEQKQQGSAYPAITDKDVKNFKFPLPHLPIQEEIVAILDRFEALVSDLKDGLPAEIAARRKQYEYYRKQLLTFPPLN